MNVSIRPTHVAQVSQTSTDVAAFGRTARLLRRHALSYAPSGDQAHDHCCALQIERTTISTDHTPKGASEF